MATTATGETLIQEILTANIQMHKAMRENADLIWDISRAAKMISQALGHGNRLLIIGNGGGAADAQHLAAEFVGRYRIERRALPALALTANTSSLTAIGNDYGFEDVFTRQVEAFAQAGDVLMCISTGGNSQNILRAALLAGALHVKTIGLTGARGRKAAEMRGPVPPCPFHRNTADSGGAHLHPSCNCGNCGSGNCPRAGSLKFKRLALSFLT